MRVDASGRSAFIVEAQRKTARIVVNQASDCLAFQREHIVCTKVDSIKVSIGYKFASEINGPEQPESPEVWETALNHLLNTYKPTYCYIRTGGTVTGLEEKVDVETQGSYRGFWDDKHDELSLTRWVYWILWKKTGSGNILLICCGFIT